MSWDHETFPVFSPCHLQLDTQGLRTNLGAAEGPSDFSVDFVLRLNLGLAL